MNHIAPEYAQIITTQRLAELDRRARAPRTRPTRSEAPRPDRRITTRLRHALTGVTSTPGAELAR